jgi:starch synthase (maltosyl-transferring)
VTVFRVDNPHTKSFDFWEWCISDIKASHPEAIFLAEAFTRPRVMHKLAKLGYTQSYTYFTWRNTRQELTEYFEELSAGEGREYFRPNVWPNTPDILHEYLQHGGPPAFRARLVLAATLSPTYGIYSGFESFENEPVRAGSEEYLDSEKFEARPRSLDGPLLPLVAALNRARRAEPALQVVDNIRWLETENDALVAYAKDDVVCVVNIDPHSPQAGACVIPVALGYPPAFNARDLVTGDTFTWRAGRNYVELPPGGSHVLKVVV